MGQTVFEKELNERGFVCERGFSQLISPFKEVIEKRGWQELVEHKNPGLSNLVREFYANMDQMGEKSVFVRGKWISFDRDTINRILNLKTIKDGHNFKKMKKKPKYQKIVDLLTNGKGKWHSTSRDQHKEILRGSLTEEAKVWLYFLASSLLPSKHLTTVRRKEAILLYSLLKGYKMNVGKIIEESILDYFNTKYRGYLPHPTIVTKLCSIQELSYYWEGEIPCPKVSSLTLTGVIRGPENKKKEKAVVEEEGETTRKVKQNPELREEAREISYLTTGTEPAGRSNSPI